MFRLSRSQLSTLNSALSPFPARERHHTFTALASHAIGTLYHLLSDALNMVRREHGPRDGSKSDPRVSQHHRKPCAWTRNTFYMGANTRARTCTHRRERETERERAREFPNTRTSLNRAAWGTCTAMYHLARDDLLLLPCHCRRHPGGSWSRNGCTAQPRAATSPSAARGSLVPRRQVLGPSVRAPPAAAVQHTFKREGHRERTTRMRRG